MMSLAGQSVLITGASRGIGEVISCELARRGAHLFLLARNEQALARVARTIVDRGGNAPRVVPCDVTQPSAVRQAVQQTVRESGGLDCLVNNAGSNLPLSSFLEMSSEQFRASIEVNLMGAVEVTRAALPSMIDRGSGAIVNIVSMAGKAAMPMWSAYCTAKHGLLGFTKVVAQEVATSGVRCNAVCPGFVQTDMLSDERLEQWASELGLTRKELVRELIYKRTPQTRFVDAQSVAHATAFLLSHEASDITGQSLNVSCGIGDY